MKPYEPDIARVRAMYRLPTAPPPNRVLELYVGAPHVLAGGAWPGSTATTARLDDPRAQLPFPAESFDVVLLHRTLEAVIERDAGFRDPTVLSGLFRRIGAVLARNGIVAGCLRRRGLHRRVLGTVVTHRSLGRALSGAGYESISTYSVLPSGDSPTRLIDTRAWLSRIAFRRELDTVHASLRWPAYLARRAVVELALNRRIEPWLAFYGRRP